MTQVRIALDVPGSAGNVRAVGRVRATPTLRRTVGDAVVLPAAFSAALVDGVVTVELAATGADWCWRVEELTAASATRYVAVPDSGTTLGYEDLTDVDPATLDPAVEPTAAWDAALAAAVASLPGFVTVVTGSEARPTTSAGVTWFDTRADQSTAPTNMSDIDQWVTGSGVDTTDPTAPTGLASSAITDTSFTVTWNAGTDDVTVTGYDWRIDGGTATTVGATPRSLDFAGLTASTAYTVEIRSRDAAGNVSAYVPLVVTTTGAAVETYSVYGAGEPTGSWVWDTTATPYIVTARGFQCSSVGARVVGGRAWIPTAASGALPTEATFYLFGPNLGPDSAAVETKVVSTAGATAGSWVQATFDVPEAMAAGEVWMIGVRFTGASDAGKYAFGTATRPDSNEVISSGPLGAELAWAAQNGATINLSSNYKIGTGAAASPAEQTQSYGVDILVDLGA